jgi:hypothetical protein
MGGYEMKITGILLIIGIVFSYVPILPMDDCQETNHAGNMKLDCGYIFHCPLLSNLGLPESITLPYFGPAVLISSLPMLDEFIHPIYHPPKKMHV